MSADDNEVESEVEVVPKQPARPMPGGTRARKRTPDEFLTRYRAVEDIAHRKGWAIACLFDDIAAEPESVHSQPNDIIAHIVAGPEAGATIISEKYQILKNDLSPKEAEVHGMLREMRLMMQAKKGESESASTLAKTSLDAMTLVVTNVAALAVTTTKAVRKQVRLKKQLQVAQEGAEDSLPQIIMSIRAALGEEKFGRMADDLLGKIGLGATKKPAKRAKRRKKARAK